MIKNRHEILFIYDVTDANPNGDPLDENKPRIDEEAGINIVTDVRLKRTIRDYLYSYKGYDGSGEHDIFVREIKDEEGDIQDGKTRALDFLNEDIEEDKERREFISAFKSGKIKIDKKEFELIKENISKKVIKKSIDVRLFGATIPIEVQKSKTKDGKKEITGSITFTGPVQFNMGRSLNKVKVTHIKGTGAFASAEGKSSKTFREEYIVPYSLIAFHGIVNENAARETKLMESDTELLYEAMWNGTKNLLTRSKMGHMPRLLIRVIYKSGLNFFIGDLQKKVKLIAEESERIRELTDFKLDMTEFINDLKHYREKVEKIIFTCDTNLQLVYEGKAIKLNEVSDIPFEEICY